MMREFTFSIDYEAGTDPMRDVFIDHPSLVARGLHGCVNDEDSGASIVMTIHLGRVHVDDRSAPRIQHWLQE